MTPPCRIRPAPLNGKCRSLRPQPQSSGRPRRPRPPVCGWLATLAWSPRATSGRARSACGPLLAPSAVPLRFLCAHLLAACSALWSLADALCLLVLAGPFFSHSGGWLLCLLQTDKIDMPSSLTSYVYTGAASCPGGNPNQPCQITINSA